MSYTRSGQAVAESDREPENGRLPPALAGHHAWSDRGTHARVPHNPPVHRHHRGDANARIVDRRYLTWKRVFDVVLVVLVAPFWLAVLGLAWLVVRAVDGAPVVFSQERVGLDGRVFVMHKLRTMRLDAEKDGAAFAGHEDPRVTWLGRLLRKTRLDELPQLFNVLKGDMSLVGPRPEQVGFAKQFDKSIPGYWDRHLVRPGLTGLAQVVQGYVADEDGTREKLRHDLRYVVAASASLDLEILARTVIVIVSGRGAR